jgi:hypothetical protein
MVGFIVVVVVAVTMKNVDFDAYDRPNSSKLLNVDAMCSQGISIQSWY